MAPDAGPAIVVLAILYGFVAAWLMRGDPGATQTPSATPQADPPSPAPRESGVTLRHDVRGMLAPALMVSDRLLAHPDPDVKRAGEVVARTVQRVTDRLAEDKVRDDAT